MPPRLPVADTIDDALNTPTASLAGIVNLADQICVEDLVEAARLLAQVLCNDGQDKRGRRAAVMLGAVMHRINFEKHGIRRDPDVPL